MDNNERMENNKGMQLPSEMSNIPSEEGTKGTGMLFVGLEVGGTNLKAGVLDGDSGQLLGDFQQERLSKGSSGCEPEAVVDQLVALGQRALDQQGITWRDARHVGIACPGQINRDAGLVVGVSTFPGWSNVPLASLMRERTGRPVTVLNDASAAASAEYVGREAEETIAVLTLGTGIGLGVVRGGRVETGSRGLIEGGHMIVEPGPNGRQCSCGQRGCLEAYASASAVVAIASERMHGRSNGDTTTKHPAPSETPAVEGAGTSAPAPAIQPSISMTASPAFPKSYRRSSTGSVGDRIRELERKAKAEEEKGSAPPSSPSLKTSSSRGKTRPGIPRMDTGYLELASPAADVPAAPSSSGSTGPGFGRGDDDGPGGEMTAADVFGMASEGDEVAKSVVDQAYAYLGLACVNLCRVLDPDAILFTGGMSQADGLVEEIKKAFSSRAWKILPHECEIGLTSTCAPGSSGVFGAASAAAGEYARQQRRERKRSWMSESPAVSISKTFSCPSPAGGAHDESVDWSAKSAERGSQLANDDRSRGMSTDGAVKGVGSSRSWVGWFVAGVGVGALVGGIVVAALSGVPQKWDAGSVRGASK